MKSTFLIFFTWAVLCVSSGYAQTLDTNVPSIKALASKNYQTKIKAIEDVTERIRQDSSEKLIADSGAILEAAIGANMSLLSGESSAALGIAQAKLIVALGRHQSGQTDSFLTQTLRIINDKLQNPIVKEAAISTIAQMSNTERILIILNNTLTDIQSGAKNSASQQILNAISWQIIPSVLTYLEQSRSLQEVENIGKVFMEVIGQSAALAILQREIQQREQNKLRAFTTKMMVIDDEEAIALSQRTVNAEKNLTTLLEFVKKNKE